jgi:hypothetical protein
LLRSARNDEGLARNDEAELSLRDAKRRSNPDEEGIHPGLLRSARNDEGLARNDEAELSLRDASGEAIQTKKAFTLDCFARNDEGLARNDGGLARNDGGRIVIARREAAKQSRRGAPLGRMENGECRVLETARSLPVIFHYPFTIFNSREARVVRGVCG